MRRLPLPSAWMVGAIRALVLSLALAGGGAASAQTADTPPDTPGGATESTEGETGGEAGGETGEGAVQPPVAPAGTAPATPATGGLSKSVSGPAAVSKTGKSITLIPSDANAPDYAAWEKLALRAEELTSDRSTSNAGLELLRGQLVDWRAALLVAQSANSTRISTLRTQIAALGPLPAEGQAEATEIAARRKTLTDQLVRLQAPGIAADEAYSRADGLIREIDRLLRERQADELLRLWPAPINPANWGAAVSGISAMTAPLWNELRSGWTRADARSEFGDNLPLILALLLFSVGLIWRGRRWIDEVTLRLQERASVRGRKIWTLLASLGQIAIPVLGVVALSVALRLTGMVGPTWSAIVDALPVVGGTVFLAKWLGGRVFPDGSGVDAPLTLMPERRAEGRLHAFLLGLVLGLDMLREVTVEMISLDEAAAAVLAFPPLVVVGILLVRLGQLLRRHVIDDTEPGEPAGYGNRLIGLLGRGAVAIGFVGPVLAAVGYVSAAQALVYPAVLSLGLLGLLFILQQLVTDIYALMARSEDDGRQALVPVLVGFVLTLATLPLFALIWGARAADITELWTRFREGFQMGETRISPTDFLYFAVLFAIGYTLTRLFQGALKSTVLPKTSLDQGGQNAIVAGVGYIGIFLAALIAINAVGIDLSGLAIVAGALSVGIGFGLQNIVSNFVSGIILLIERPVSEGDWIDVAGVQGTVRAISVRSTRIQTFDRSDVIVPNSDLVSGQVTNFTRFNLTGRLIVPVGVAYGSDTRKVAGVLQEIAEAQPLAVLNPLPVVAFMGFGADSMNFEIRVILRDINFSLAVRTEINHAIALRFAEEGIDMPFAQRDIWLRNPEAFLDILNAAQSALPGSPGLAAVPPQIPEPQDAGAQGTAPPQDSEPQNPKPQDSDPGRAAPPPAFRSKEPHP